MIHPNTASMLKESIPEALTVAINSFYNRKQNGGCYGYPCSILLFSIVDTIGSYYFGSDLEIKIDGVNKKISSDDFQHFFILNSEKYYKQNLTENEIKKIYDNFRSNLSHNLALPPEHFLIIGDTNLPFVQYTNDNKPIINLAKFIEISTNAVNVFINEVDNIVPQSIQNEHINSRRF
jgi:hypothetical protein